jgi:hypothetical protein
MRMLFEKKKKKKEKTEKKTRSGYFLRDYVVRK